MKQKRCTELQIPHSYSQRLEHVKQYRRMITHRASESVYCTTKRRRSLVAALLRVAGVTAGLAESNGSLPPGIIPIHVTCRLTAKNRDQLQNPTLGNRVGGPRPL